MNKGSTRLAYRAELDSGLREPVDRAARVPVTPAKRPASCAAKKSSVPPVTNELLSDMDLAPQALGRLAVEPQKKLLPHHQPRQTPVSSKVKASDTVRPATPQTASCKMIPRFADISGKKGANPVGGKNMMFYTNLIRASKKESSVPRPAVGSTRPSRAAAAVSGSKPLPSSKDGKKLNTSHKHSSSMGNAEWLVCYDKLRKELNFNSPKDAAAAVAKQQTGRASCAGVRPKEGHMLMMDGKAAKRGNGEFSRPLLKPGKCVAQCLTPRVDAILGHDRRTPCSKYSPGELMRSHNEVPTGGNKAGTMEKGKFAQILMQFNEGKGHQLISGLGAKTGPRRPVIATHNFS